MRKKHTVSTSETTGQNPFTPLPTVAAEPSPMNQTALLLPVPPIVQAEPETVKVPTPQAEPIKPPTVKPDAARLLFIETQGEVIRMIGRLPSDIDRLSLLQNVRGIIADGLKKQKEEIEKALALIGGSSLPSVQPSSEPKIKTVKTGTVADKILAAGKSLNGKGQSEIEAMLGIKGIFAALKKLTANGNLRKEGSKYQFVK